MWLISILPFAFSSFVITTLMIIAIVAIALSYFLKANPYVATYAFPIRVISIIILFLCSYYMGVLDTEKKWQDRVSELEQRVQIAEKLSKETNKEIEIKYVDKVRRIKETEYVIQEKIKEVEKVIDAQCTITPESISILNQAARGEVK
jgi:membrane protein implicated in regulation of membrane protease activity